MVDWLDGCRTKEVANELKKTNLFFVEPIETNACAKIVVVFLWKVWENEDLQYICQMDRTVSTGGYVLFFLPPNHEKAELGVFIKLLLWRCREQFIRSMRGNLAMIVGGNKRGGHLVNATSAAKETHIVITLRWNRLDRLPYANSCIQQRQSHPS